ncbi:MAG: FliG C-terminal domain-containing protein [Pseudomonadota bacterium]
MTRSLTSPGPKGQRALKANETGGHMPLTYPEKAAIVISTLGPSAAEPLLRTMSEDDVRAFARASSKIEEVPARLVEATLSEFLHGLEDKRLSMSSDKLKMILASVMSDDAIERILEDMDETEGRSIWEKLSASDPIDLGNYLAREHPQTVAVVLSRLRPETSAKLMQRFEPEFAEEVIMRLSNVSALGGAVLDAVKSSIEGDFLRGARMRKSKRKPDEVIGSIFNFLAGEKRDELMAGLEEKAPSLAVAVQRKMFTFNDIPARVDRASVSMIVREVENEVLIKALCAAAKNAPESKAYFLENISRRLGEQLVEQIEAAGVPSARDGEEAQFEVVGVIRKMAERGAIELSMPEEEEMLDD